MIFGKCVNFKYTNKGTENFGVVVLLIMVAIKKVIAEYIQNQLQDDRVADQLTLLETVDPFTSEANKKK
jgi:putative transposase